MAVGPENSSSSPSTPALFAARLGRCSWRRVGCALTEERRSSEICGTEGHGIPVTTAAEAPLELLSDLRDCGDLCPDFSPCRPPHFTLSSEAPAFGAALKKRPRRKHVGAHRRRLPSYGGPRVILRGRRRVTPNADDGRRAISRDQRSLAEPCRARAHDKRLGYRPWRSDPNW